MENLIEAIRKSCETENWHAALYIALTMPDICAGIENPGTTSKGVRYKAWFDEYLRQAFVGNGSFCFLTADDCWALRNSLLHEGSDMLQGAKAIVSQVKFTTLNMHRCRVEDVALFNVAAFCGDVIKAVQTWLERKGSDPEIAERLSAMARVEKSTFDIGLVRFGR